MSTRLPTTSAQYGIWVAQQMSPASPAYLTAEVIVLQGMPDLAALDLSVREVLTHCEALHMRFEVDADGLWQIPTGADCQALVSHDLSAADEPELAARAWIDAMLAQPVDLVRGPLFRTALLRTDSREWWWVLAVHHIVLDGFGYSLICQTLAERYSARVSGQPLPALPDWSLAPVLAAEQRYREVGGMARDQAFWLAHLQAPSPPAQIAAAAGFPDGVRRRDACLGPAEIARIQAAARQCGQDWGSWMLTAIGLWLAAQSGQRALTFGMPVMNRLGTPAISVPCMAMNILPLSLHLHEGDTPRMLCRQIAEAVRAIRPHLYYRYGWIRMDLGLMAQQKHLFNQAVNILPFDRSAAFSGLGARIHPVHAGPVKDLNISVFVLNSEWRLRLEANPDAYPDGRLDALHADLQQWLVCFAAQPAEQPLTLPQNEAMAAGV